MAHFKAGIDIKRETPAEWLKVGAQIGHVVNDWAGREDLVAFVGNGAGQGIAPALYSPNTAEIEVNVEIAFGKTKPNHIRDMQERDCQFEFPKASGAIYHEAMHARHSTWDLEKAAKEFEKQPSVLRALHLLEESRIEKLGITERPENRSFLRSCALDIVLSDMTDEGVANLSDTRQAAQLAGLSLARVDAGVLNEDDIIALKSQIGAFIPDDLMEKLQRIWREFQAITYPEYDTEHMYDLAREWDKLVQDQAEENGEGQEGEGGEGGEGESGSGMSQAMKDLMDALAENAEATSVDAQTEANRQQQREDDEREVKGRNADAEERQQNQEKASEVFGQGTGPLDSKSYSRLYEKRKPTHDERAAAVKVARELERARYRERDSRKVPSVTPPGRLRSRAVIEGRALKSQGIHKEVESFKRTQRTRVDDPKLTIGVMVDISGSMSVAMQPLAVSAWVMSEAVRRVQGKVGMVYYGNDVFPTLKPGQHLDEVEVYTAADGTEKFDRAFRALDGQMHLLHGTGARLLVVCSDGYYTSEEQKAADHWLARCRSAGVGVLWISYPGGSNEYAVDYCRKNGANHIKSSADFTDAALKIGAAAADALTRAGRNR